MSKGRGGMPGRKWVRWTKAMRQGFLDHLAATCNVTDAAAVVGVDPACVYTLRRREPAFADAWGEALALGYEMLETRVVGHALAGERGDVDTTAVDGSPRPVNVELALRLLGLHRNATGKPRRGGSMPHIATADETDRAIVAKLAKIAARRRAAAAEAAEAAAGVATASAEPTA